MDHTRSRATVELPDSAPVVIIGGGIVGVATAWFLGQKGIPAVVLEAESSLGSRTTAMSAHCIRAQFGEPDNIQMMAESLSFYEAIGEHCGVDIVPSIDLTQQGYLFASTDAASRGEFADRVTRQAASGLADVVLLSGDEIRERWPWMSAEIEVGTFRQRDGWIDSSLAIAAMASSCDQQFHTGVQVDHIAVARGRVAGVATDRGFIATETVILAAGPGSRALSPEPLPITLLRRHRVVISPRDGIPQDGPVTIDANTGSHWRPHRGGALAAWALPAEDGAEQWPVPTEPGFVDHILRSEGGIGRLSPLWRKLADELRPDEVLLTAGQYSMTPDHRPLIGPAVQTGGLFLHTGYSGHGIMGAPSGARLLADLLDAATDVPNAFDPGRFAAGSAEPDVERVII